MPSGIRSCRVARRSSVVLQAVPASAAPSGCLTLLLLAHGPAGPARQGYAIGRKMPLRLSQDCQSILLCRSHRRRADFGILKTTARTKKPDTHEVPGFPLSQCTPTVAQSSVRFEHRLSPESWPGSSRPRLDCSCSVASDSRSLTSPVTTRQASQIRPNIRFLPLPPTTPRTRCRRRDRV